VHVLTPSGGVASELTVTRIDETRFYLTSAAAAQRHDLDLLRARARGHNVRVRDVSDEIGVLGLMGPSAAALLASFCDADLSQQAFSWLTAREIEVEGAVLRALRLSYVGESGFELHMPMEKLEGVYTALVAEGARHDLTRFGAFAMNAMRLEKGYRAWGVDLTTERSPLEAGLGHIVRTQGRKFVGRDGLLAREADEPWRMGLLALGSGEVDPFGMHAVLSAGEVIGVTTSGGYGHRTGTALALAYFRGPVPEPALELHVDLLGVQRPARVLGACPYDPANTRMRA
jgi:dimethylglycine dehydrogenase